MSLLEIGLKKNLVTQGQIKDQIRSYVSKQIKIPEYETVKKMPNFFLHAVCDEILLADHVLIGI